MITFYVKLTLFYCRCETLLEQPPQGRTTTGSVWTTQSLTWMLTQFQDLFKTVFELGMTIRGTLKECWVKFRIIQSIFQYSTAFIENISLSSLLYVEIKWEFLLAFILHIFILPFLWGVQSDVHGSIPLLLLTTTRWHRCSKQSYEWPAQGHPWSFMA